MSKQLAPPLKAFDDYMARSGDAWPDFDSMRSWADLPPLLEFVDGRRVNTDADWLARREEIRTLLCRWFYGSFPATPPKLSNAELLLEEAEYRGTRRQVRLTFDCPTKQVAFDIELLIPEGPGPHPVFLTQTTHRVWGLIAMSRGYMACVYPGADVDDQSARFVDAYPECDWTTIPRRAWLGSRALDYVQTLAVADKQRVCITGHSRNGKQSLIAAAFDERIKAVVSSSSGSGGICPYRFSSEVAMLESVEFTTRLCPDWFHQRLRMFTGREDKLPVDSHSVLGLIAPRACLLSDAFNDGCGGTFAVERAYTAGRELYKHFGHPEALRLAWRPAGHETNAELLQSYFDWFDHALQRRGDMHQLDFHAEFPEVLLHEFKFDAWRRAHGDAVEQPPTGDVEATRAARVRWGLGTQPPTGVEWGSRYGQAKPHDLTLVGRGYVPDDVAMMGVQFSDYVQGYLYHSKQIDKPAPVVIWLHTTSGPQGFTGCYMAGDRIYHELVRQGFAVFTFDQIGWGLRLHEARRFYERFPDWSLLGRMVRDTSAAVDFLEDGKGKGSYAVNERWNVKLPPLDLSRVYTLGYGMGGMLSLYAAALDQRIAGAASFAGFTPMRTDTDAKPTGGIRRLWQWYRLAPRLGLYHGKESQLPYDYDDLLQLIAPRPCLVVSPTHDREADLADVTACVEASRPAWAAQGDRLEQRSPEDYSRFQTPQHEIAIDWLHRVAGTK